MMPDTSPLPLLSIGLISGGQDTDRRWVNEVLKLMRRVIEVVGEDDSPAILRVNVIYQAHGEILQPDFTGVRTGSYSKKRRRLIVQAALPPHPSDDAAAEVRGLLAAAIDAAEQFARQRRIADGLPEIRAQLDRL